MEIYGHRGSGVGPGENTLASIVAALAHPGVHGVEIDARRCADGQLVLCHEPVHDGVTLLASTPDQLPGLCLLSEALEAARGRARLIIEIKNVTWEPDFDATGEATIEAVMPLLQDQDDVVISSFDFSAVEAARDRGLRAALLTMPGMRPMAGICWGADAGIAEVHAWIGDVLGEPACVAQAEAAGLRLVTWTAESRDQLDQLAAIGIDGAISDVMPA